MLGLLAVIAGVVYFGWGKVQEMLVNRAIAQKLAEAGLTPEVLKKLGEAGDLAESELPEGLSA